MCVTLEYIRAQRVLAVARREHHEVMRRQREEYEHLAKCIECAGVTHELYQQLWRNAHVGVDVPTQGVQ